MTNAMKLYAKIKVIVFLLIQSRSISFYKQYTQFIHSSTAADMHYNSAFQCGLLSPATNILHKSQLAYRNVVSLVFLS